ncbi:sensor histidine kinase [Paenibacillus sp. MABNR03]|uniref:sensor histidine kinase n=1 Tax=Paenibacillus sp. MABNR03 TaxID=3142626 RepID=UPI003D2E19E1
MLKQYRTFLSAVIIILLSTIVVLMMYSYTVETSLDTVKKDIQTNNLNRLRILVNSLDFNVEQLNMLSVALNAESKMGLLKSVDMMDNYEQDQLILDLSEKIKLQSFTQGWNVQIDIYSTLLNKWVGSSQNETSPSADLADGQWVLEGQQKLFSMYRKYDQYTVRVTFPKANLENMLDSAKIENNDPFFYYFDSVIIANRSYQNSLVQELVSKISPMMMDKSEGTELITIGNKDYMVSFLKAQTLGWYMVDYVPLDKALQPIVRTQFFFYITCVLLFLSGVITLIFFYRKVQVPILTLLKGVRHLQKGDFSHRISRTSNTEFAILYHNFNNMAQQIEDLIENVYKEKIISREALVKQLQAQINPHFLYNCLFFINNMNRMGNDEAVNAMTQNLAEYFRYTTRINDPLTTLEKEIGVVRNYLNIQSLRINRLHTQINIQESMMSLLVPKLLIQPLVENSVIHGIEKKQSAGLIHISGTDEGDRFSLVVEDDGKGMNPEEIRSLLHRIEQPLDDTMGCALWNIRQRMLIQLGSKASLNITQSKHGGIRMELVWDKSSELEE